MVKKVVLFFIGGVVGLIAASVYAVISFQKTYHNRVYPGIYAEHVTLSGKSKEEILSLFQEKNDALKQTEVSLHVEDRVATISAEQLAYSFDENSIADNALRFGRTGNYRDDAQFKLTSLWWTLAVSASSPLVVLEITPEFEKTIIDETVDTLASYVDVAPIEPLFEFNEETTRVTTFKLGSDGKKLNQETAREEIQRALLEQAGESIVLTFTPETVVPTTNTKDIDNLGIVELLATGESYFKGSISGRVHNVLLAASRASGILVAPGEIFSFNKSVGDISAATGYKSAYIIKNGRTILDDGGGVCQVSTTLFRAALNAGLEITERKAHSYRVTYYEQGGFKPGLDATVYDPLVDLKIKNNTSYHILIQAKPDPKNFKLTYEIYGKSDGRVAAVTNARIWDQTAPPPPVFQDDPTLAPGEVKQVDWEAWGAKAAFDYTVTRNGEEIIKKTFVSNFRPWQAVYLQGVTQ